MEGGTSGLEETAVRMAGEQDKDRLHQRTEEEMCEAHVTLGRLSHVKACHGETAERMMQSLADAGAGDAVESAMAKVRVEYEALKENLEQLYRKSMADLHARKLTIEAPTRARVELVMGQQKAVDKAEEELKAVMAIPHEEVLMRELPQALRRASRTLKSSTKLIGLRLQQVKPVSAEDFPPGRLHNVTIAPKRPGQRKRGKVQPRDCGAGVRERSGSATRPQPTLREGEEGEEDENEEERERAPRRRPATPLRSLSSSSSFSDDKRDDPPAPETQSQFQSLPTAAAAAVATGDEAAETAVAAGAAAAAEVEAGVRGATDAGCCRNGQPSRAPAAWDEERGEELGVIGGAPLGGEAEACGHCACGCRADDVWAAYKNLRKRYRALKDRADQEEVRIRIEEQRREMQSELERQKLEAQAELDQKKLEMETEFETKRRELQADLDGKIGEVETAAAAAAMAPAAASESVLTLSQAEVQSLREIVHASLAESNAVQQESAELRQKVALGEECLQEALNEALSLRGEITRRKQHGEVLLARIRFLTGQTSAHVKNTDRRAGEQGWGGMGTAAAVYPMSDYGSDSAIGSMAHRTRSTAGARRPTAAARRRRPRRLGGELGPSEYDAARHPAFPRSPPGANGHESGGYQSPPCELSTPKAADRSNRHGRPSGDLADTSEDDASRHPAFLRSPSEANAHDGGGYQSPPCELPSARDAAGGVTSWVETSEGPVSRPWIGRGGDVDGREWEGGDAKATRLEREREHLTREVYKLSAQLEASGVTSASSKVGPSDPEDLGPRSFSSSASVPVDAPAPPAGRSRRRDEAAAAAAEAEEAAAVAVAAAEKFSKTKAAAPRRGKKLRGQRGDGGDDSGTVGTGRNRHRSYREHRNVVPYPLRGSSSAMSINVLGVSVHDLDCDSATSGSSSSGRSGSPSWRSLARRRQQSLLAAEVFSRLPQRQRQRRQRDNEAAAAKARRMAERATEAVALCRPGAGDSDSVASDKILSEGSAGEFSDTRSSGSFW